MQKKRGDGHDVTDDEMHDLLGGVPPIYSDSRFERGEPTPSSQRLKKITKMYMHSQTLGSKAPYGSNRDTFHDLSFKY